MILLPLVARPQFPIVPSKDSIARMSSGVKKTWTYAPLSDSRSSPHRWSADSLPSPPSPDRRTPLFLEEPELSSTSTKVLKFSLIRSWLDDRGRTIAPLCRAHDSDTACTDVPCAEAMAPRVGSADTGFEDDDDDGRYAHCPPRVLYAM